jgi:hypothetical protein
MNGDLLYADCVIDHLISLSVIKIRVWRDSNPADHDYEITFDNPKKNTIEITLQINIRAGQFYTNRSRINILSRLYHFNPEPILTGCAV